eukprot:43403-Pelagomonas_calceolata.AAC.6
MAFKMESSNGFRPMFYMLLVGGRGGRPILHVKGPQAGAPVWPHLQAQLSAAPPALLSSPESLKFLCLSCHPFMIQLRSRFLGSPCRIAEDRANCELIAREVVAIQQLVLMALGEHDVVVRQACKTIGRHTRRLVVAEQCTGCDGECAISVAVLGEHDVHTAGVGVGVGVGVCACNPNYGTVQAKHGGVFGTEEHGQFFRNAQSVVSILTMDLGQQNCMVCQASMAIGGDVTEGVAKQYLRHQKALRKNTGLAQERLQNNA